MTTDADRLGGMTIPIEYVDRPGNRVGASLTEKSPIIEVEIGFGEKLEKVRALVDTGAHNILVDEGLIARTECPIVPGRTSLIATKDARTIHPMYKAQIVFPSIQAKGEVAVVSAKIQDGTKAFDAVFGTQFLELGRLVIDTRGKSHFTFYKDSVRKKEAAG